MPVFGQLSLPLFIAGCTPWVARVTSLSTSGSETYRSHHQPITRRERRLQSPAPESSVTLAEVGAAAADLDERGCPGGETCQEKADKAMWNQACWDCKTCWDWAGDQDCYRDVYCEKYGLTSPKPTYVAVCATDYEQKNAYCKKFAEADPPMYYEDCMFLGSDFTSMYCKKLEKAGNLTQVCAAHPDVGPSYCESFAVHDTAYLHVHDGHSLERAGQADPYDYCKYWPQYMLTFCEKKKTESAWDINCAAHDEVGEKYCVGFAAETDIRDECATYRSYLADFCDIKASSNSTYDKCAQEGDFGATYCMELARKHNNYRECWPVGRFNSTYCAEMKDVPGRACASCGAVGRCLIE